MRSLIIALSYFLCCFNGVLADKDAIGNEILSFYYIYKMQYTSGGQMTTGGEVCRNRRPICQFDEYVKDVMAKKFADAYRPAAGDHTLSPSESGGNLDAFNNVVNNAGNRKPPIPVQYRLDAVVGRLDGTEQGERASGPEVVRRMMAIANRARSQNGVAVQDLQGALDNARLALVARFNQKNTKAAFDTALHSLVSGDAISYLVKDGNGWYDWRGSLKSIDNAQRAGTIDAATRASYKDQIRQFARKIRAPGGSPESTLVHLDLLQKWQSGITQLDRWIAIRTGQPRTAGC